MKPKHRLTIVLVALFLLCQGIYHIRSAIPLNTFRNNAGLTTPYVNATQGYYMGATELIDANFNYNGYNITQLGQYPQQPTTYTIDVTAGIFRAKNGETGAIDYSGANPATVVQNAVNASTNGGRILFKEAVFPGYTFSSKIIIPYSLIIEGEGEGTYIRNNIADDYIFDIRADYVTIKNIYFNGQSKKGHAIVVEDARQVNIEKNLFYNFQIPIDINNSIQSSNKGWIRDNVFTVCDYGILFRSPSGMFANEFQVEGNYFSVSSNAIELGGGDGINSDIWITHNTFGNSDVSINFLSNRTYYTKIFFNHMENATTAQVNFTASPDYIQIMHNRMQNPAFVGSPGVDSFIAMNSGTGSLVYSIEWYNVGDDYYIFNVTSDGTLNYYKEIADYDLFNVTSDGSMTVRTNVTTPELVATTGITLGGVYRTSWPSALGLSDQGLNTTDDVVFASVNITGKSEFGTQLNVTSEINVNFEWSGTSAVLHAGENLVAGNLVYINATGYLWKADADQNTTIPCVAIVLETINEGDYGLVLMQGWIYNSGWTLDEGKEVFVSTTAGAVTVTAPSGAGDQVQVVGIGLTEDLMWFNPDYTILEVL